MELGPSCEQKHSAVLQIVQEETVLLLQHKHTLPAISLAEWKFRPLNYHKPSSLKHHSFLISQCRRSGVQQAGLGSLLGVSQGQSQGASWLGLLLETW